MYIQCKLKRNNSIQTAWIPKKFVSEGKYLKLKQKDDIWENGWKIIESNGVPMDIKEQSKFKGRSQTWYGNDYVKKDGDWGSISG